MCVCVYVCGVCVCVRVDVCVCVCEFLYTKLYFLVSMKTGSWWLE